MAWRGNRLFCAGTIVLAKTTHQAKNAIQKGKWIDPIHFPFFVRFFAMLSRRGGRALAHALGKSEAIHVKIDGMENVSAKNTATSRTMAKIGCDMETVARS